MVRVQRIDRRELGKVEVGFQVDSNESALILIDSLEHITAMLRTNLRPATAACVAQYPYYVGTVLDAEVM